jgi:hypothetical protein
MPNWPRCFTYFSILLFPLFLHAQEDGTGGWGIGPYLGYDLIAKRTNLNVDIRGGSVEEVTNHLSAPRLGLSIRRKFTPPIAIVLDVSYQEYDFSEEKFLFTTGPTDVYRRWQYEEERINLDLSFQYFLVDRKTSLFAGAGLYHAINISSKVLRTYEFGDLEPTIEEDLPIGGSDSGVFLELGGGIGPLILRTRITFLDRTSSDRFYKGSVMGASLNYLF